MVIVGLADCRVCQFHSRQAHSIHIFAAMKTGLEFMYEKGGKEEGIMAQLPLMLECMLARCPGTIMVTFKI